MRTSALLGVGAVTVVAALIRLLPLTQYLYWGADYGEYLVISQSLVDHGTVPQPYPGWGIAYPYFPGMEALAAVANLFGVPLEAALLILPPVLASASVVGVFLLAWEVTEHEGASLVAAAFVALAMPHVYPTSHAIPASIGDLLYVGAILAVIHGRRDRRWLVLLVPSLGAIVLLHHFSTYFLIIALGATLFLRILVHHRPWPRVRSDLAVLYLLLGLAMAHWYLYATEFRERVLTDEHTVPLVISVGAFGLAFAAFPVLIHLRPRLPWNYRPLYPEWVSTRKHLALGTMAALAFLAATFVVPIPGTTIVLGSVATVVFVPLLLLVAFSGAGRKYTEAAPGGLTLAAVLVSLFGSMALGLLVSPRALIPYRHVEYLMVPAAIFSGAGAMVVVNRLSSPRARAAVALAVALLVAGTAASAYPPRVVLGGFFEGYPPGSADPPAWIAHQVPPGEVIASDHRLSSLVFGLGHHNATWDYINATLHAPDFPSAAEEMRLTKTPVGFVRIDYVLLDDDVRRGAMLYPWDPALPLTPQANAKFLRAPYVVVYDDGYSQVYWVDWGSP